MNQVTSNQSYYIRAAIKALRDLQSYFDKALNDITSFYVKSKDILESNISSLI